MKIELAFVKEETLPRPAKIYDANFSSLSTTAIFNNKSFPYLRVFLFVYLKEVIISGKKLIRILSWLISQILDIHYNLIYFVPDLGF